MGSDISSRFFLKYPSVKSNGPALLWVASALSLIPHLGEKIQITTRCGKESDFSVHLGCPVSAGLNFCSPIIIFLHMKPFLSHTCLLYIRRVCT